MVRFQVPSKCKGNKIKRLFITQFDSVILHFRRTIQSLSNYYYYWVWMRAIHNIPNRNRKKKCPKFMCTNSFRFLLAFLLSLPRKSCHQHCRTSCETWKWETCDRNRILRIKEMFYSINAFSLKVEINRWIVFGTFSIHEVVMFLQQYCHYVNGKRWYA